MIEKKYVLLAIIAGLIIIWCEDTQFEIVGFTCSFVLLGIMTFLQIFKYNKIKCRISSISFALKRENIWGPLINCYIVGRSIYGKNSHSLIFSDFSSIQGKKEILLLIFVLIELYICIAHKPILSTEGFLCSSGKFISFEEISSIVEDETPLLKNKRLTVIYKKDDSVGFRLKEEDLQNVKNHIQFYSGISFLNKSKNANLDL